MLSPRSEVRYELLWAGSGCGPGGGVAGGAGLCAICLQGQPALRREHGAHCDFVFSLQLERAQQFLFPSVLGEQRAMASLGSFPDIAKLTLIARWAASRCPRLARGSEVGRPLRPCHLTVCQAASRG